MRNVIVYDKETGKELGVFPHLPDSDEEQKAIVGAKLGQKTFRLRWKVRERKDGKLVEFPRQKLLRCAPPLTLDTQPVNYDTPSPKRPATPEMPTLTQMQGMGEQPFLVQLILNQLQMNHTDIVKRLELILDYLEQEPDDLGGLPGEVNETPQGLGGIFQSIISDPAYSGLVGAVIAHANNPEAMADAIKAETENNPKLVSGLIGKILPSLMQGQE